MFELTIDQIKNILPHRGPMLLIEKMTVRDKHASASYRFKGDEWFFQGHYPDDPIVPGAILCEIMAQASCGLFIDNIKNKTPYLITMNHVKFRKTVKPEDILTVDSFFTEMKGPFYHTNCKTYVNEILTAEGEFSFILK